MRVTLDVNVLRDMLDSRRPGHADAIRLARLIREEKVEAQVTTRIDVDVPADPLKSIIAGLPEICEDRVGAPFRLGYSRLDSGDYLASSREAEEADELMLVLFPGADAGNLRHRNRLADVDHLLSHRRSGANWFITSEKALVQNATVLRDRFFICVSTPKDFADHHR